MKKHCPRCTRRRRTFIPLQDAWLMMLALLLHAPMGLMVVGSCSSTVSPPPCGHQIYCQGRLLNAVQLSCIFNDSKTFVDMPCKFPVAQILASAQFHLFQNSSSKPSNVQIKEFVKQHFGQPGSDLIPWTPTDWISNPPGLSNISDLRLRVWMQDLNARWKVLGRQMVDDVKQVPDQHSLMYVPNPFIVPGGRFREFYYWDTYWIIKGMLICGLTGSAMGMIDNFVGLVDRFGFVPNGGRIYYSRRSQPPMLTLMVASLFSMNKNRTYLANVVPILEREHTFWMRNRSFTTHGGFKLNRYHVETSGPRPESYQEDWTTAERAPREDERMNIWSEIASGAETGWDFSSRWLSNSDDLASIRTSDILPVDLNSILYKVETTLAYFHTALNNETAAEIWKYKASQRAVAMNSLMWNDTTYEWRDYNISAQEQQERVYASMFVPIWAGLGDSWNVTTISRWITSLAKQTGDGPANGWFGYYSGIPTSMFDSSQQWDFPNVWPPLVSMAVFGLQRLSDRYPAALVLATNLAQKYVNSSYTSWATSPKRLMFEKYDATTNGGSGKGGEYVPQNGFGWTNGVALEFVTQFNLHAPPTN